MDSPPEILTGAQKASHILRHLLNSLQSIEEDPNDPNAFYLSATVSILNVVRYDKQDENGAQHAARFALAAAKHLKRRKPATVVDESGERSRTEAEPHKEYRERVRKFIEEYDHMLSAPVQDLSKEQPLWSATRIDCPPEFLRLGGVVLYARVPRHTQWPKDSDIPRPLAAFPDLIKPPTSTSLPGVIQLVKKDRPQYENRIQIFRTANDTTATVALTAVAEMTRGHATRFEELSRWLSTLQPLPPASTSPASSQA